MRVSLEGKYCLEANGYGSHEEWLRDWRDARSDDFFVLGSRDGTAGCQLCVTSIADDGSLTLKLRLPDGLAGGHGKYLTIAGVYFAYGHEQVLAALHSNAEYARHRRQHGEKAARATYLGQAISYRFKRDGRGWRVFATTEMMDIPVVTDRSLGVIGVDLNADHLAIAETDASGNCINAFSVPLVTYGKSTHRAGSPPIGLRRSSATPWPAWCVMPARSASPLSSSSWTSGRRRYPWRASPAGTAACCHTSATAGSRLISSPVAIAKGWRFIR